MVTLQNHVLSILAKSAKIAADDIIKLFDSSFEAFSEELRKRQDEIDALRRKLEESEPKDVEPNSSGPAYLCAQCGVSLNCVISIDENPKNHDTDRDSSPPDIETNFTDQPMLHAPIIESETEEDFEFEVTAEDDTSYSELIQKDKNTDCIQTVHHEKPTPHKVESNLQIIPQKRGRGRPRKQPVEPVHMHVEPVHMHVEPVHMHVEPVHMHVEPVHMPPKRGRGRPRKTEVVVTLKSQPNMFSGPEQPKKTQTQKEITKKPQPMHRVQPVQPSPPQATINHSLSKEKTHTVPKLQLQLTRSGRRGRPPRRLLDPLLIPFAGTKNVLSGPKNHACEPVALTNELEDKFLPKAEKPVPLDSKEKGQPDKGQPKKERTWVKCPNCPRLYPSKAKMQIHMKAHHRKGENACHICGLTFIGTTQMTNHLRVHTGEKPYSCNFCSRRFPNQSQYNKHILNHTAPDYTCEVCGLKSSQVRKDTSRKAHLRSKVPCSNCACIYT